MTPIRPSKNLYGVTHDANGQPRVIEPKTVKVGIGLAKGKAVHTYIDLEKRWVVVSGYGNQVVRERFTTKIEAQKFYRKARETAPDRKYPERLSHFTFSHISASGDFEPDWDIIEAHGPIPTEIDVIFVHDDPFHAAYQFWTSTEKKCEGDGKVALRALSMAETEQEKALAAEADRHGEKTFPVTQCWLSGCRYAKPAQDRPAPCRPMARLLFQLLNSPRLGGTAVFTTAGYRSISQIFSSIQIFRRATGAGDPERGFVAGIPLKMVLRPYRAMHAGKAMTQYAVSLEFRAASALALKRGLVEQAVQYRLADREPLKQLAADPDGEKAFEEPRVPEENPDAVLAEFDPDPIADEPAGQLDPDGPLDEADLGPGGAIEHAWDDAILSPAPPRITAEEKSQIYHLSRARGMTDAVLINILGTIGYESVAEIQPKDVQQVLGVIKAYQPPGQGNLL